MLSLRFDDPCMGDDAHAETIGLPNGITSQLHRHKYRTTGFLCVYIAGKANALIKFLRRVVVFLRLQRDLAAADLAAAIGNGE